MGAGKQKQAAALAKIRAESEAAKEARAKRKVDMRYKSNTSKIFMPAILALTLAEMNKTFYNK